MTAEQLQTRLIGDRQAVHPLARIYLARALDPVIEVAQAVARDFDHRPGRYAAAPADLVRLFRNFQSQTGTDAWEDPEYRDLLHPLERDIIPPHPAGEIDLEGTIRTEPPRFGCREMAFSTITVDLEICCCSGDLGCTNGQCTGGDDCPTLTSILT